ncbi:hypothetical protein BDR03DRAFT_938990 [Suillus americanus]|nr:hypothetical protein BDR03DRAFT_938990 [Suillus americanus]
MMICTDCGGTVIEYDAAVGNSFCVKCGILSRKIPSTVDGLINYGALKDLFVNGPQVLSLDDKDNSYTMHDKYDGEGMIVLEEDGGGTGSQRPAPRLHREEHGEEGEDDEK